MLLLLFIHTVCGLQCQNGDTDSNCTSCVCNPGYTGTLCNSIIDYCSNNNNCGLYGTCMNDTNAMSYTCNCIEGWDGPTCSLCTINNCDECTGTPPVCKSCQQDYVLESTGMYNNIIQDCVNYSVHYVIGRNCVLRDLCPLLPCMNNGTCISLAAGSYECSCTDRWTGINCTVCANNHGRNHTSAMMDCGSLIL